SDGSTTARTFNQGCWPRSAPTFCGRSSRRVANLSDRPTGEVAERLNAPVSKTGMGGSVHRGFESLPLRFVMSRDMCLTCLASWVSVGGARPSAGLFLLVAPVAVVGLDLVC